VQGRKLQDHIEGLHQYLSVAEADDLVRMKAPPRPPLPRPARIRGSPATAVAEAYLPAAGAAVGEAAGGKNDVTSSARHSSALPMG